MENYKLATKQKLRFQTNKGLLSTEQLWELSLDELDALAVSLKEQHEESGKKSFLVKKSEKDKTAKLRFDVAYDILMTKKEEAETLAEAQEIKEHNNKILTLIKDKQDETLKGKSIEQLEKMLK